MTAEELAGFVDQTRAADDAIIAARAAPPSLESLGTRVSEIEQNFLTDEEVLTKQFEELSDGLVSTMNETIDNMEKKVVELCNTASQKIKQVSKLATTVLLRDSPVSPLAVVALSTWHQQQH